MIKLTETSRKILRAIYRGVGVAAIALTATSCWVPSLFEPDRAEYGMPPDYREDFRIQGRVVNKRTGEPINGIAVYIQHIEYQTFTGFNGYFYFWLPKLHNTYTLLFTDIDGDANGGHFKQRTIVLTKEEAHGQNPIIIELEEIE